MTVELRPSWDPSGTVSVRVSAERSELVTIAEGELRQFSLSERSAEGLGWIERTLEEGLARRRRVGVSEVFQACLREWEAEQAVGELCERAIERAKARGPGWTAAGRRLERELACARRAPRVSVVPFRVLFAHRSDPAHQQPLSVSAAAERVGFLTKAGKPDTQRLRRRLGLADQHDSKRREPQRQHAVGYRTGVALCRAIDIDPVELGL